MDKQAKTILFGITLTIACCRAEGVGLQGARIVNQPSANAVLVRNYAALWDSINAKRAPWASNPWVWVVEFRRAA